MISVDHGIEIRDNFNNVIVSSKILDETYLVNSEYFKRNEKYWFDTEYWSKEHPIAPSELNLNAEEILQNLRIEIDGMKIYNFYHYVKVSSSY
jgi:hypothetical protein